MLLEKNLELQKELTNESLTKGLALLAQERGKLHQQHDEEMSQLRVATNAVTKKETDGVSRAEQADEKMRLRTKKDLRRLHAVKLDLQRFLGNTKVSCIIGYLISSFIFV